jgi:chemotaxis protein CheX
VIDIDNLLDSFRDTTLHVIKSMAPGVELVPGRIVLPEQYDHKCDIIGNISLTGEGQLSLALRFSAEAVASIYADLFGDDAGPAEPSHIADLVGEITNMVCGNAKNILTELDMRFEASIPITIVGVQQIYHPQGTIVKLIPVSVNGFPMSVQVSIKSE